MTPAKITTLVVTGVLLLITAGMVGLPSYNVYVQGMNGTAALKRAIQEKQILIEQARAEVESAKLRATAIKIVGAAAKEFPEYRLQEFMAAFADALQNDSISKIIFVPTEANIPIMNVGRTVR